MSGFKVMELDAPEVDIKSAYRYAGVKALDSNTEKVFEECMEEMLPMLCYKVCFGEFDINIAHGITDLTFVRVDSRLLETRLKGCDKIIVFAATIGLGADRVINKFSKVSPFKAVICQGIGTERVESLCDAFCGTLEGATPRFSPGYGDFPLEVQKDIFSALDLYRNLGITLNDSMLITPTKTVTAIVGIKA